MKWLYSIIFICHVFCGNIYWISLNRVLCIQSGTKKSFQTIWKFVLEELLLHPHSRENGDTEIMKQIFLEKSSEIIWKFKRKTLIFASTFAKRKRQKSSLRDLHNSTSSTSIRKINFPDWYRQRSMTLDYNNGFRSEDIKTI